MEYLKTSNILSIDKNKKGILLFVLLLILSFNLVNRDALQTYNLISTELIIYPKSGNREERANWRCESWKLTNTKCKTWIKKFSEVEDPYFDLDPAEFPSLVGDITAEDLNRPSNEFLIFDLY